MATVGRKPSRRAPGPPAWLTTGSYVPPAERAARGRSCRFETPRSSHAAWQPEVDRQDPVALLEEQAAERVSELVPIRYGRMSASPFAFYRGAAYVMAYDLAGTPQTGIRVQLCGDAHLANFGGFASAERQLLFDLVDFDETLPGPWEWDVKRLAASVAVAGRENGFKVKRRTAIVRQLVGEYRQAMRQFSTTSLWMCGMHERAERSPGAVALAGQREPSQAVREGGREGRTKGQRPSVREACSEAQRRCTHPG